MKIHGKVLDKERISKLLESIKQKRELEAMSRTFIKEQLHKFLLDDYKSLKYLFKAKISPRSKEYKNIVKQVRARLRRFHGLFSEKKDLDERQELFEKLHDAKNWKQVKILSKKILKTHASTKERLALYDFLYPETFKIIGKVNSIIDLGAGLNPLSLVDMSILNKKQKQEYYAYDINEKEISQLNLFFQKVSEHYPLFKGKAEILDLLHWENVSQLPEVDLALLFKVTDVLDRRKGHKLSENIITNLHAKYILLSFPTFTISGKRMVAPRRAWVEMMCKRLGYEFKVRERKNEIFYLIMKN